MKKLISLTALVLGLTGGVAAADRGHDHDRRGGTTVVREHGRGNVVVRENVNINHGGSRVIVRNDNYRRNDNYHRPHGYYGTRRPIYVQRPVIRERYYRHDYRPALIVENYGPRDGYYWVRGDWTWTGYEWIWQPGHYEPAY